ncbi:DNA-directed DNA polymerase [Caerostris extrusa]|uniref:DNA-directed DNA polymerase n=1 Tax=Caerostris extrusa TaxID=172846 RepID=A0AAV4XXB2_CAEEX|nr:DNA-directed DNA polymerase [Caerostris extrusa]
MTPVKRTFSQILSKMKACLFKIVMMMLPSGIAGVPLGTIVGALRQLFLTIIERSTETLAPTDLIRFYIQDDHLDHPISTTIMPVSDLTIEKILTEILKVLQSKKSIQLDSGFKVEVTYKGKERPLRINLWHHDNHYDVIKSVKGFFGSNYYCENCEKPTVVANHIAVQRHVTYVSVMSCPPDNHKRRIATDFVYLKVVIRHTNCHGKKEKSLCDKIYPMQNAAK